LFFKYFALLQAWYLADLAWYVGQIAPLASYAQLGWFAQVFWGHWPNAIILVLVSSIGILASIVWVVFRPKVQLMLVSILALATLEGLVYSFGYQANTFSSWRVVSIFIVLESMAPNTAASAGIRKIGLFGLSLCYFLPGLEKVINSLPLLSADLDWGIMPEAITNGAFGAHEIEISIAIIAFQLSAILLPNAPTYRRIWCLLAVSFHLCVWLILGIGGWQSPWIWVLPYFLAEKSGK
jgi:hypothetical protein